MSDAQLETLIAKIAATSAGASPTPNDLTDDQQRVVLQYQLLRNGLIRHSLPAEKTSQVLIRITQRVCNDKLELIADDPIPQAAVSLRVTIGDDPSKAACLLSRVPGKVFTDVDWCKSDPGVSLVEFIDARRNTVAAGIPSPLEKSYQDPPCVSSLAESVLSEIVAVWGPPPSWAAETQSASDEEVEQAQLARDDPPPGNASRAVWAAWLDQHGIFYPDGDGEDVYGNPVPAATRDELRVIWQQAFSEEVIEEFENPSSSE
jgi:hypothetical protein